MTGVIDLYLKNVLNEYAFEYDSNKRNNILIDAMHSDVIKDSQVYDFLYGLMCTFYVFNFK